MNALCQTIFVLGCGVSMLALDPLTARADQDQAGSSTAAKGASDADDGIKPPDWMGMRLTIEFLAGYGSDSSNSLLGFSRQGRVGYAILGVQGKAGDRFSYRISMNPVNEIDPLPACGVSGFFYPNEPKHLYGETTEVPCAPKNGNRRVDAYRGIALDVVPQQGALREAYLDARLVNGLNVRVGRMKLPMGFDWQQAGSFTSKDAPRIQRINSQYNFALMVSYTGLNRSRSRPLYSTQIAASLGDGNRWWDYNYFYFEDTSLGSNLDPTLHVIGTLMPTRSLEFRAAYQKGTTGSKVERRPSYWASKRNDDAVVLGFSYRPIRAFDVTVERASYTWGPTDTSARMLDANYSGIKKRGFYVTVEGRRQLTTNLALGGSLSREELDRADSLVRFMAARQLYNVTTGRTDRLLVLRGFVDVARTLRVGFYQTQDFNPYPWLSGISPIAGPQALSKFNIRKWGLITRFSVM